MVNQPARPLLGLGLEGRRLSGQRGRVQARALCRPGPAVVHPAAHLRAVDLGMELDREVPAQREGLDAELVPGQYRRVRRD